MKTNSVSFNYKYNKIADTKSRNVKFNFKRLLLLFFGLKRFNNNIYLIGFPESGKSFYKLFNYFNIKYLKENTWTTGLFSNPTYINKFIKSRRFNLMLKRKNQNIKNFINLNTKCLPSLIVLYEKKPYTKYILKECANLKIPVVIMFDNIMRRDINYMKVFHTVDKDLFTRYIFFLFKSLLKKQKPSW